MCQAEEEQILNEFGVEQKEISYESMIEQLRLNGANQAIIESLDEGGATEHMVGFCASFRPILLDAMRQERFGGVFAEAMRQDPAQFGQLAVEAMLPIFDQTSGSGSGLRHQVVAMMGQALAALEFGAVESLQDEGFEPYGAEQLAGAPLRAILTFFPKSVHSEILASQQRLLLKAQTEGTKVFHPDYIYLEESAQTIRSPKTPL